MKPEHIDLEALLETGGDTEEAEDAELTAGPARRTGHEPLPEEVLADCGRRQVGAQLRHLAQHPGREGVRVGPRPDLVLIGIGIGLDGRVDALDQRFDLRATQVRQQDRGVAIPAAVGRAVADGHHGTIAASIPASHFVDRVARCIPGLDRDPGMHAEVAAPAHGARGIDLGHGFGVLGRVRREPDRLATGLAPVTGRQVGGAIEMRNRKRGQGQQQQPFEPTQAHTQSIPRSTRSSRSANPSATTLRLAWKARMAARVAGPGTPSAGPGSKPLSASAAWIALI